MLLALLLAVLGPDYRTQPQCLVNLGCAAARWPGVPDPKPLPRCANPGPALTVAAALHQATTGWRRFLGWISVPRVRIAAQLRSGGALLTTLVMCQATNVCCNRVSGNLVLADEASGFEQEWAHFIVMPEDRGFGRMGLGRQLPTQHLP